MARFVALFRGINVGKAKRVAMVDLRELLESLGYSGARTLLNSGNVVFDGPAGPSAKHAQRIQAAVAKKLGVDALVIVKTDKDVAAIVTGNKLGAIAKDPSRLLVAITNDDKVLASLKRFATTERGSDVVQVGKHAAYAWCANGLLESKVGVALLKDLSQTGTTRNWATVEKLHAMMQCGDKPRIMPPRK
ncbi:MAG: DUF1697 domain-containing protein [Planctomycetes bacterium]|nr:DUF1697 domain-containing protein [Planctomycetota bacterium]